VQGVNARVLAPVVHVDSLTVGAFRLRSLDLPVLAGPLFDGLDGILGAQGFATATKLSVSLVDRSCTIAVSPRRPDTPAGAYPLDVRATLGDFDVLGSVMVVVDCQPPFILSAPGHQPTGTSVTSGQTANVTVSPTGTAAYRYQWYLGHSGNTNFPIAGATSATLKTPAITGPTEFWVRVSNPCGSVDSQTATVTTK